MNKEHNVNAPVPARITTLSAVITRANGTVEDLGVIASSEVSTGPVEPSANSRKEQ